MLHGEVPLVINNTGLSELNQRLTDVDQRAAATLVHRGADNVEMTNEEAGESTLAVDDGILVKQEPLEQDCTETCYNVYNSLLDVYKHELCNESTEMEHYSDSLVDTPARVTDISVGDVKTHVKLEPFHAEVSLSSDCALTQATCSAKDRATPQDAKTGEASSVQQNCLGPGTQQTLYKVLATDSREASSADSAPRGSVVRRGDARSRRELLSCEHCSYTTVVKSFLVRHMRTHTGEKPYLCKYCDHKCSAASHLKIHIRTHTGEKPYSCEYCNYKCSRVCSLKIHTRTHTGERPYSCKYCGYQCSQLNTIKIHIMAHTGEKPYMCKHCHYKCSAASSLKTHMRTHTGERPYSCKYCDYKCSQSGNLKTHMMAHTGVKPYSCKYCDRKYSQASSLKTHMRTHTGEKPFSCEHCEYRCTRASYLEEHTRTHGLIDQ